jgi:hypothetical protein
MERTGIKAASIMWIAKQCERPSATGSEGSVDNLGSAEVGRRKLEEIEKKREGKF